MKLNKSELIVTASKELQEEVEKELQQAQASTEESRPSMKDILEDECNKPTSKKR